MSGHSYRGGQGPLSGFVSAERDMSRRTLGRSVFGWRPVIGLLFIFAVLGAACTGPAAQGGGEGGGEGAVPNPDVLIVTTDDEPATLDPAQVAGTDIARSGIFNVYDRLVDIPAGEAELGPSLATEVPSVDNGLISEDGLTYTFPIREGVTFHDGTELTAQDVKFSWDRVVEMDLPEGQSEIFAGIAETRAVDDYTFEVTLEEPDGAFLRSVAAAMAASIVSPDAVEANGGVVAGQPNEYMAQNMVGTGPYSFVEWARGDHLSFDIFQEYWGEPAHLPVRWLVPIKEGAVGLRAKDYDIISTVPQEVPAAQAIPHAQVNTDALGLQLLEIGFNMKIDPATLPDGDNIPADFFHDPRVRQAFNYAFPYQDYIEGVLAGVADRGSFVLPQGMFGHDPDAPIYSYDPAKAEQLFREAGWWDRGFTVSILVDGSNQTFNGAALAMKDGIEKLNPNFHVNVLGVPEARFDQLITNDPVPASMWSYTSPELRSPAEYFANAAHPEGTWGSLAGFSNGYTDPERVASMIAEARRTVDVDRRLEMYSELQQLLYEEAMWVMPAQEGAPIAYGQWMKGVVINPMWPRPTTRWALYDK